MCWWYEWVDQHDQWAPYRALKAFVAGEDLRGTAAGSILLACTGGARPLWGRAWCTPDRVLGYVIDRAWGSSGDKAPEQAGVSIAGEGLAAGDWQVEWWDADTGTILGRDPLNHPGGAWTLTAPGFRRHMAFKIVRQ